MKKMKKRFLLSMASTALILSLLLTGCGAKYTTTEAAYVPEEDFQYQYSDLSSSTTITESDEGYYFLVGNYIFFLEKGGNTPEPFCHKPSCLHTKEDDPYRVTDCDAFVRGMYTSWLQYYAGKLYTIETAPTASTAVDLVEIDVADGGRKSLYRFDGIPSILALHRGYLYFSGTLYTSTGEISSYGIHRLSLRSSVMKPETIYEKKMANGSINCVLPYQNMIYFEESELQEDETFKTAIYLYDCISGELRQMDDHVEEDGISFKGSLIGFYQDNLLFCWGGRDAENEWVRKYKLHSLYSDEVTELSALTENCQSFDYTDGTYIYKHDIFKDELYLRMYDEAGNELVKIPMESNGGYPGQDVIPGNNQLLVCSYSGGKITAYSKEELSQGIVNPIVILDVDVNELLKATITTVE